MEGQVQVQYVKGSMDEGTMTYVGEKPLVFAVHLEQIVFNRDSAEITGMTPLAVAIKVLGKERIWDFGDL
jgi:hypothetical protein